MLVVSPASRIDSPISAGMGRKDTAQPAAIDYAGVGVRAVVDSMTYLTAWRALPQCPTGPAKPPTHQTRKKG